MDDVFLSLEPNNRTTKVSQAYMEINLTLI